MKTSSHVTRRGRDRQPGRGGDACELLVVHLDAVLQARSGLPHAGEVRRLAELLMLLANPTRLSILLALLPAAERTSPELCVCDLAVVSGASRSLTSHQLRLLRTAGLVSLRRQGKLSFYRLSQGPIRALLKAALQQERTSPGESRCSRARQPGREGRSSV